MKKLYLLMFALLLASVSVFNSCKPDPDDVQNPEFQMNDGINIYYEDVIHYLGDVFLGDSLIFFDASMPEELMPKENEHIFIPVTDKTPYGVLANVKTVRKTDKIIVEIEPMSLDEAFEFLTIDESTPITTELEGVFDIDGNPMEFEVVDTTEIDLNDTIVNPMNNRGFTLFKFDENCIKIPVKIAKTESGNDKIEVSGIAYIGFHNFKFEIDNAEGLKYLNLNATPYVKLGVQNKIATENNVLEISQRVGQIHFKITVPTPAGIPIIFPVTLYVNAGFGIRGELSATLGLQYEYNCNCVAKFDNGQWIRNVTHGGTDKSPWVVSEFDVKGEIYSGFKLGLLVGLYSATSGIGFNLEPKLSLATQAQLSSEDLLKTNPNVDLSLKAGSELYCIAKLFGKKLPKLSVQFPDFTLWSQKMYLLPNITEFTAEGDKTSADISWKHDIVYFLSAIGLKTGTAVFESNGITEIASYKPSPSGNDVESYYYDVTATGLSTGETYYAAPFAYWNDYVWYGEMEEFTIEEDDEEYETLKQLYEDTNGDNWTNNDNWLSDKPLNEWYGLTLTEDGYVKSIDLADNNLTGEFNLNALKKLQSINISNNALESINITTHTINSIELINCIVDYGSTSIYGPKLVTIKDNSEIGSLNIECETLIVDNCNFGETSTPFSSVNATSVLITNSTMYNCGLNNDYLTFENSKTTNTWHCNTNIQAKLINSYCSVICSWDFSESATIIVSNTTLFQPEWNENKTGKYSFTTNSDGWAKMFE